MNCANKLTIFRIFLIFPFVFFLLTPAIKNNFLFSELIFLLACATDAVDGWIARKYGQVTHFGKVLDPMADKILVICGLICFIKLGMIGAVPTIIVVVRELMVVSVRLLAANQVVIVADIFGKLKTILQMTCIVFMIACKHCEKKRLIFFRAEGLKFVLIVWMVFATVASGINYVWKNRKLLKEL
ncbi:MAG: CDP-diacylglycerol--glycerol-3-phosphate 3-phosphatidyltransferase [Oscillospiraceae bacterium]|nr:CDP-diacylglycerol--glycerol-3-phosphate 3-phosphatidyltransferase [Oscillospiraceae bacterium]